MKVPSICQSARASSPLSGFLVFFLTCYVRSMESAQFTVVGPDRPVMAVVGEEIVLPCHLAPRMSAENMEVTWYRSELSPFVHRCSNGQDQYGEQMPEYQGRTELLKDGLTHGNVALKILHVRLSDEGRYSCSVQDGLFLEEAILELMVADPFFPKVNPWMVSLGVTLVVLLGSFALSVYLFRIKGKHTGEAEKHLSTIGWRGVAFPTGEANVTLDPDTAHPQLVLSEDGKHVSWERTRQPLTDTPERYDFWECVLGREGFTSERHCWEVVKAINRVLLRRVVRLANPDTVIRGFGTLGFPNCRGAIDGMHIPIRAPEHQASRYVNRKGYFSMILQAVCDHRGQFTDINVGWSGKAHDARVYRNSSVCQRLQAGTFFPDRHIRVGDVDMPMCLVGDASYPLQPWLMKPYTGHLNPSRQTFNARLTWARIVVEGAFGRLKARFRCLLTRLDLAEHNIPPVVAACCVLHNLCERKGEAFLPAEADRMAGHYGQPCTAAIREAQRGAVRIREALRESFLVEEED
ncbi:butyrophilin subfamily 3 member A3-like isoform X2 [Pelodiscus sinensis]|uniref:butyrophilin subfamily 3 member A3-like isoform X2 n=1 Tax=Pelodiscus sinensis TaxID=13735 RepID=UPI003F6AEE9A